MWLPLLLLVAIALLVAVWALRAARRGGAATPRDGTVPPDPDAAGNRAATTERDATAAASRDDSSAASRDDSATDRQSPLELEATAAAWRPIRAARARRHPVVLAHGLLGFGTLGVAGFRHDYFRGVAARLRALDVDVVVTRVAPLASIEARARQLAEQILDLDAERVDVVAHSMGGLDARLAIAEMGIADRVATLVTVGTPHHGTPLADGGAAVIAGLRRLGIDLAALHDLSTGRMADLNRRMRDVPGVAYLSYVGASAPGSAHVLLRPSARFLQRRAGANDGLVPAASQRWGVVLGEIDADHWAQIGWGARFDAVGFYEAVALRLRGSGPKW